MTGKCKPWEVWVAAVKFEDSDEIKNRPVVITDTGTAVLLALKVTTHSPRQQFEGEYPLVRWCAAGLKKPSTVRMGAILKLEQRDLLYMIGRLHPVDILEIRGYLNG